MIVLNKIDLVSADELAAVEARIRGINPTARIHHADHSRVPVTAILDQGAFDLGRVLERTPDFLENTDHEHNDDIHSMSFEVHEKINGPRFNQWIGLLLQERGGDILRTKGILDFAGEDRRYAFQAVHMMADGDFIGPWREGETRSSRIVFIGRNLNRAAAAPGLRELRRLLGETDQAAWSGVLEKRGTTRLLEGQIVACAVAEDGTAAFATGEGRLHLLSGGAWRDVEVHEGAILALAVDRGADGGFVTGGDDGTLRRIRPGEEPRAIAAFGGRWVDAIATGRDGKTPLIAASFGKRVRLFGAADAELRTIEYPSTVTGLAFDARGKKIAASHYNGATISFVNSRATRRACSSGRAAISASPSTPRARRWSPRCRRTRCTAGACPTATTCG